MNLIDIARFGMYFWVASMIADYVPAPMSLIAILGIVFGEMLWKIEYNKLVYRLWQLEKDEDDEATEA